MIRDAANVIGLNKTQMKRTFLSAALVPIVILGLANAEYYKVYSKIEQDGAVAAFIATFDISIVVWFGIFLLLSIAVEIEKAKWSVYDPVVVALVFTGILFPVSGVSWLVLSILATYIFLNSGDDANSKYFSILLAALCFNGFWSPMIFRFFTEIILQFDSLIIGLVTGTTVRGNLIEAADGLTTLQVLAACSSFSNISLAFLGWIIGRSYFRTANIYSTMAYLPLTILSVIAVNTLRIGIIALRPDLYDLAHGAFGSNVASILSTALIYIFVKRGTEK